MNKIISFEERRLAKTPHKEGRALCLQCHHDWQAVAPIGTTQLECPSCHLMQGVFYGVMSTERPQWQCACGEFVFFIDQRGPYCAHCGVRPEHMCCE